MKILALDSSSVAASVAILEEDKLLSEIVINYQRTHSEKLVPMIQEALTYCGLKPKDIDIFASTLGPGSFTGLRIGITTIKAMAQALDKPVVGISTLEALAYQFPYCNKLLCPIIDAQREMVYTALYRWHDQGLEELMKPQVIELKQLVGLLKDRGQGILFSGDAVALYKSLIKDEMGAAAGFPPQSWVIARAAAVAELAHIKIAAGEVQGAADLLPIYMRKSQAEKQYEERMKGKVQD